MVRMKITYRQPSLTHGFPLSASSDAAEVARLRPPEAKQKRGWWWYRNGGHGRGEGTARRGVCVTDVRR